MKRKKIAVFVDWFPPAYKAGGPITSVSNLVHLLKSSYDIDVFTATTDIDGSCYLNEDEKNVWQKKDNFRVIYLDKTHLELIELELIKNDYDLLHVNSMFSKSFALAPIKSAKKLKIKTIVSPRGMLGESALKIKSSKKKAFFAMVKMNGLLKEVIFHATNSQEEKDIQKKFKSNQICIAKNVPFQCEDTFEELLNKKRKNQVKKFLFVGRLAQIKNIHLLVSWMSKMNQEFFHLDIIGPKEDEQVWNKIESLLSSNIQYHGSLKQKEVSGFLAETNYLILPSGGENYGHAIVEAWAHACPVIISDKTPWKDLTNKNIGWDVPIDEKKFIQVLQRAIALSDEDYKRMSEDSFLFFQNQILSDTLKQENIQLYNV